MFFNPIVFSREHKIIKQYIRCSTGMASIQLTKWDRKNRLLGYILRKKKTETVKLEYSLKKKVDDNHWKIGRRMY